MKAKAIRIATQGGPEVLQLRDVELAAPGVGEALIRQTAIGVNFIDVYFRDGTYPNAVPAGIGAEAVGFIEAIGQGVDEFQVGDRVAYAGSAPGAYADLRVMPVARLVSVPRNIPDEVAAAALMKGMTVEYLLNRCFAVQPMQDVLFYAASGGVGLIAGQWGRHIGARMIGVTTGREKISLARAHGYDEVIDRREEKIAERVRALTQGRGADVVYDSVGRDTFEDTLDSLKPRGCFVSFGTTTGSPPPLDAEWLQKRGSLYYTRPTLGTYIQKREELVASAASVFKLIEAGIITPKIGQRYALTNVANAHRELESAQTTGSSIIVPS